MGLWTAKPGLGRLIPLPQDDLFALAAWFMTEAQPGSHWLLVINDNIRALARTNQREIVILAWDVGGAVAFGGNRDRADPCLIARRTAPQRLSGVDRDEDTNIPQIIQFWPAEEYTINEHNGVGGGQLWRFLNRDIVVRIEQCPAITPVSIWPERKKQRGTDGRVVVGIKVVAHPRWKFMPPVPFRPWTMEVVDLDADDRTAKAVQRRYKLVGKGSFSSGGSPVNGYADGM